MARHASESSEVAVRLPDPRRPQHQKLAAIVKELDERLNRDLSVDELAYAFLTQGNELRPWTQEAERRWERAADGPDDWRQHHLAVLYHAHAYDLETQSSHEAPRYWKQALTYWARVHADDGFWDRMSRHLTERMGVAVDRAVVTAVRARLPQDLLAPHVSLATSYRTTDVTRGREHVRLVVDAEFPVEAVMEARESLVRDVLAEVPQAIEEARFGEMTGQLKSWLAIDPTSPFLARALLLLNRKALEPTWNEPGRLKRVAGSIATVEELVRPALSAAEPFDGPFDGPLAAEAGRYEYWRGVEALDRAMEDWERDSSGRSDQVNRRSEEATGRFEQALEYDAAIAVDDYYQDVKHHLLTAAKLGAATALARKERRDATTMFRTAARRLRRAISLKPTDPESRLLLAQLIVEAPDSCVGPVADAEEILKQAEACLTDESGDGARRAIRQLMAVILARKWQERLASGEASITSLIDEGLDADGLEQVAARDARIVDELQATLRRNPDDPDALWALLIAQQGLLKPLWNRHDGGSQIRSKVSVLDSQVRQAITRAGTPTGRLAAAIARHEYWLGVSLLRGAQECLSDEPDPAIMPLVSDDGQRAVRHFQRAVAVDPAITEGDYYDDIKRMEGAAEAITGIASLATGSPSSAVQHLRRGVQLDPTDIQSHLYLAQALVADPSSGSYELNDAERALRTAKDLAKGRNPRGFHEVLRAVENQLEARRRMHRLFQ